MNFLAQSFTFRRSHQAAASRSQAAPARDIQWGRPVFRAPDLPMYPRLNNTVPFTAMRPLRPTSPDKQEVGS